MKCLCCGMPLIRSTDLPDARWLRPGDLWCDSCELGIAREQLVEGWPTQPRPCKRHRDTAVKGEA